MNADSNQCSLSYNFEQCSCLTSPLMHVLPICRFRCKAKTDLAGNAIRYALYRPRVSRPNRTRPPFATSHRLGIMEQMREGDHPAVSSLKFNRELAGEGGGCNVADPDPGFGIRCFFVSRTGIHDNLFLLIPDLGSRIRPRASEHFFGLKYLNSL
jgi:hypothetical protein